MMRIIERLLYFFSGVAVTQQVLGFSHGHVRVVHALLLALTVLCQMLEGIRLVQIPLLLGLLPHLLLYFAFSSKVLMPLFAIGLTASLYFLNLCGDCSFDKVKRSGPYRVGFKSFTSHDLENDCAVFYPAAGDGSGTQDVKHMCYGRKTVDGQVHVCKHVMPQFAPLIRFVTKSQSKVTLPGVYRDARLGVETM